MKKQKETSPTKQVLLEYRFGYENNFKINIIKGANIVAVDDGSLLAVGIPSIKIKETRYFMLIGIGEEVPKNATFIGCLRHSSTRSDVNIFEIKNPKTWPPKE